MHWLFVRRPQYFPRCTVVKGTGESKSVLIGSSTPILPYYYALKNVTVYFASYNRHLPQITWQWASFFFHSVDGLLAPPWIASVCTKFALHNIYFAQSLYQLLCVVSDTPNWHVQSYFSTKQTNLDILAGSVTPSSLIALLTQSGWHSSCSHGHFTA